MRLFITVTFFCFAASSMLGQCFVDRHNTNTETGWISCTPSTNPNASRGQSHWIMYDMTFDYALDMLHVWNFNHPAQLNNGARQVAIDISNDGLSWINAATVQIAQSTGSSFYEGQDIIDLSGNRARFVLLTILSNWGGGCFAISEVRIGVKDESDCQPNISLTSDLSSKKYLAEQTINVSSEILSNNVVVLQAGQSIDINLGFAVSPMAEFKVDIGPCH